MKSPMVLAAAMLLSVAAAAPGDGPGGAPLPVDLEGPEYNPASCPAWAKERVPEWVRPFMGVNGAPEAWRPRNKPFATSVQGIDRYQANHFVWYRPETARYLYGEYTALEVGYKPGLLPSFERIAARFTAGCTTDTERAVALLTKAMPEVFRHPGMPPLGPGVKADRNLEDEALLATGCGWCNEQARVFIRLCQVSGIPARMIHLFGQNHTVAEFHADGTWALADASNMFVARGSGGRLLSAAQCHDRGENQRLYAQAKERRMQELASMTDEQLGFTDPAAAARWREEARKLQADELATREVAFGVMNYPLPR